MYHTTGDVLVRKRVLPHLNTWSREKVLGSSLLPLTCGMKDCWFLLYHSPGIARRRGNEYHQLNATMQQTSCDPIVKVKVVWSLNNTRKAQLWQLEWDIIIGSTIRSRVTAKPILWTIATCQTISRFFVCLLKARCLLFLPASWNNLLPFSCAQIRPILHYHRGAFVLFS